VAKPQVVHFHNTFPLISPAAYYACQDLQIPVIQTLDNQRLICPAASFYRDGRLCLDCLGKTLPWPGVLHACYHHSRLHTAVVASMLTTHRLMGTWQKKVDRFLCSTNFYRELFVQAGLPADKIAVVPHFVWDGPGPGASDETGEYALFIGRLDPEKGIKTLLEAWRHLDLPLKIRGTGLLESHARDSVRQHAMDQIEFVGRLEEVELDALIRRARFLVVPSEGYYETFGMVIIEAYARGVPVVASNIGVIPEMVSDGQTGLLFEAGDARDLASKAAWMWEHPRDARAMGSASYKVFQERFQPEHCYRILVGVYETLIRSK
jgi:glycosyltransferase involved in cell wall biosynthesis